LIISALVMDIHFFICQLDIERCASASEPEKLAQP
jgi:hypothetical protein